MFTKAVSLQYEIPETTTDRAFPSRQEVLELLGEDSDAEMEWPPVPSEAAVNVDGAGEEKQSCKSGIVTLAEDSEDRVDSP